MSPGKSTDIAVTMTPLLETIEARIVFEGDPAHRRGDPTVELLLLREDGRFVAAPEVKRTFVEKEFAYTFWPTRAGRYRFDVTYNRSEAHSDGFDFTGEEKVVVEIPVKLTLRAPYIAGTAVHAADGRAAKNAVVQVHYFPAGTKPARWDGGSFLAIGKTGRFFFPGPGGRSITTKADEDGRFLLLLPTEEPTTAFLNVRNRHQGYAYLQGSADVGWSQELELSIDPTTELQNIVLEVEDGRLEGEVIDAAGVPVAGEVVVLYDARSFPAWKTTGPDGRFHFEGLRSGSYALEALGQAGSVRTGHRSASHDLVGLPAPEEFFDRRIDIVSGETRHVTLDLSKHRLGAIEGRVAEGALPPGKTAARKVEYGIVFGGRAHQIMTLGGSVYAADGVFQVAGLFPGRYRVWTVAHGRGPDLLLAEAEVDVVRGATSSLTLEPPRGCLEVPIPLDRAGSPVAGFRVTHIERYSHTSGSGDEQWDRLGNYRVRRHEEELLIEGVVSGLLCVRTIAPGFRETTSEAVHVRGEETVRLRPPRLEAGRRIVIPASAPELVAEVEFTVFEGELGDVSFSATQEGEGDDRRWILSAFAPGEYHVSAWKKLDVIGGARVTVTDEADCHAVIHVEAKN